MCRAKSAGAKGNEKESGRKIKVNGAGEDRSIFCGNDIGEGGAAAKSRKALCCAVGAKRQPDPGELYKHALDAHTELNKTPFLDPDFIKKYTEVCELYRKISSCAENALKKLTKELSEIVDLQERFSAGDTKALYEMGRRIIAIIDRRYKKGLCDDGGAVDLSLDLLDKLSEAAWGGDKRARVVLVELRKSWERWGEAGKRMAMPPPCARPAKKQKANKRSRATTAKPRGRSPRKAKRTT